MLIIKLFFTLEKIITKWFSRTLMVKLVPDARPSSDCTDKHMQKEAGARGKYSLYS